MIRIALLSIFLLAGISTTIVYMQWNHYTDGKVEKKSVPLVHNIAIEYKQQLLEIRQEVSGIRDGRYEIWIPKTVNDLSCAAKPQCVIQNKNGKQVVITSGLNELEFRYKISLPNQPKEILIPNWSIVFDTNQEQQFNMKLLDFSKRSGEWIAGAKLEGKVKRGDFTYYSWVQRNLLSFPLYYHPGALKRTTEGLAEIYANHNVDINEWNTSAVGKIADVPSLTVVVAPINQQYISPTLLVLPKNKSFQAIQTDYIRAYYRSRFMPNSGVPEWVWDLLAALTTNEEVDSQLHRTIFKYVNSELDDRTKKLFLDNVLKHKGKKLTPQILDDSLGQALGGYTSFFADNTRNNNGRLEPLFIREKWTIFVHGEPLRDVQPIIKDKQRLLPFVEVMAKLGYKVKKSGQAVFIDREYNSWRFFVNSNIYMEGNNRFGATSTIIHEIGGKLYISEEMLKEWFYVDVQKREEGVYISNQ